MNNDGMFSNGDKEQNQSDGVFVTEESYESTVSIFNSVPEKKEQVPENVTYQTKAYCPECGKEYSKGESQRFCSNCGYDLMNKSNEEARKDLPKENVSELGESTGNITASPDVSTDEKDMTVWEMYLDFWQKAFDYKGSVSRKQYWMTVLINAVVSVVFMLISVVPIIATLYSVYAIAAFVAGTALNTRRLHDTGRSGHWQWLCLTVYGSIAVLVFLCQQEKQEDNKYKVY